MRIKCIQQPTQVSVDGLRLDRFEPGYQYEVGNSLGALMLAEGWASPVAFEEPALVVPFSEVDPHAPKSFREAGAPPNLTREHYPPYLVDDLAAAADFERRRRRRPKVR
jgi:hypothetical protein